MEKTNWLFVNGTHGDAHFRVGLQKYVIPAPLYLEDLAQQEVTESFAYTDTK